MANSLTLPSNNPVVQGYSPPDGTLTKWPLRLVCPTTEWQIKSEKPSQDGYPRDCPATREATPSLNGCQLKLPSNRTSQPLKGKPGNRDCMRKIRRGGGRVKQEDGFGGWGLNENGPRQSASTPTGPGPPKPFKSSSTNSSLP